MVSPCYAIEFLQYPETSLVHVTVLYRRCAWAGRQVLTWPVFSCKEAPCQREVGDDAESFFKAKWFKVALVLCALEQIILRLQAFVADVAMLLAYLQRFSQSSCTIVGGTDVTHLALPHEVGKGRHCLFEWCIRVIAMRLVEVDYIDLQAFQ